METLTALLVQQPLLTLFLVIAGGYALGAINIKGFSLGVGAVLFSGLLIGAIAPNAQPPALVGTLGLVMFLYGLGVQFGRQFFAGLTSSDGRRYNALAGLTLAAAAAVTVVAMAVTGASHAMTAGLFAGAGTNAATMQAAMEAAGNSDPAVGYSVAFPFGLVGAILCMYFMQVLVKPNVEASLQSGLRTLEVAVRSPEVVGRPLGEVASRLPDGVQVLAVRAQGENRHPEPGQRFWVQTTCCGWRAPTSVRSTRRGRWWANMRRGAWSATAARSTTCASSCRDRTWWACACPTSGGQRASRQR